MTTEPGVLRDLLFRNSHLLVLAVLVIALAGLSALSNLPRIEDPRITTRNALVLTQFPGASAERVEALVTEPLEEELRGVEEIKEIKSTSRANISILSIELVDSIDASTNEQAFSRIRDRLAEAEAALPPGAGKPSFDDERGASAFALVVALSSTANNQQSLGMLSRLGDELADRLRNLPGAERVSVYGDTEEEITVTLDRGELASQGLTAASIAQLVGAADPKGAAGALRASDRDLYLEVGGELDSAARIRGLVLRQGADGRQLRLGDIARVERRWREPPESYGYVNGVRSVFVAAAASENVRIDRWQVAADAVVERFAASLDGSVRVEEVFRQSEYTRDRLSSLGNNLAMGAAVVMLVVLVGMGWRAALIVGSALPLSAFATLFGLTFFGQQIHQMTIFGMIIAIGLLIDNAIVVTDEIHRRLRAGSGRREAVAGAVSHLSAPLLASTVTTILGFMPIFLLPGNIGDFVGPIAISVVLALSASFVISLTIIAALAGRFLDRDGGPASHDRRWWRDGIEARRLTALSRRLLTRLFQRPVAAIGLALVLPVLGFVLAGTLRLEFFPPADRDQFEIEVWMADDASVSRTRDLGLEIEQALRERPGVRQVSWLVGGSHPQLYYNRIMKQDNNAAYAHAMVLAESTAAANRLVVELQDELDERFPGAQIIVAPFAQGPPVDAPVGFRIVGPSSATLTRLGNELRRVMHEVPGIRHTRASIASRAKLTFDADQGMAGRAGLTLDGIAAELQGNLEGFTGGSVREDLETLPVRIRYDGDVRGSFASIASMPLTAGSGERWVPADALGEMRLEPESASITRRNGERVNTVHGWVRPGVLPIEAANAVLARLDAAGFELPPGYRLELEGDSDAQQDAVAALTTYLPVLLMLMVTTLVLSFRSAAAAGVIGAVALLSAGLGMLSLKLSGFNLGFNPLIGSAGLIGVAINGAIVVLAALRANREARQGSVAAIVEITIGEARHVLATTATTIGGFLPLFVFSGGEFWPPLAVVIAGGVGFSVILSLVFTPAVFALMTRPSPRLAALPAGSSVAAVLLLFLGGCAVGPDYEAPDAGDSGEWIDTAAEAGAGQAGWWRDFDDPLIEAYVTTALDTNNDVAVARANLAEARALALVARSRLLPTLNANGSVTDFKLSEENPQFANAAGLAPLTGELYDAGFDSRWELDVFGGNRSRTAAGYARGEQSAHLLEAVRLSVAAEVVRAIVELRGLQRRLDVAERNEANQTETLTLVESRQQSGLAPELDVLNARAQLEGTRSSLPQLEAGIRTAALRLATLTATDAAAVVADFTPRRPIPTLDRTLEPGLRGDVLRRRPDVRAAERAMAAATADLGVAVADFYPKFTLNANYGWQALSTSSLGDPATETSALLGIVSVPLFAGGRLRANRDAADARLVASEARYRQAVLLAIEESEGAINRYRRSQASVAHLSESASASADAAVIARRLYESGLRGFLAVLDAERRRLIAEEALASRQTEAVLNLVAVYKALGAI